MRNQENNTSFRAPVVAVLGHVDHGKTTLLDAIRSTNIAGREAGGITQSIGASVVTLKSDDGQNKSICFIDTPGHAIFSKMRSRGAGIADLAILVVGADDGVKPQTKEALEYILSSGIPYIVAATKMDVMSADIEKVRSDLNNLGVRFENEGGDVPLVPVSARKNEGIKKLLEMILLISELQNIKGSDNSLLEGYVLETGKDRRGLGASVIVKNGKMEVGDEIVTETGVTKVRNIFGADGKALKKVGAGEPGFVIGFSDLPAVGTKVWGKGQNDDLQKFVKSANIPISIKSGQLPILVKSKSAGSLEALLAQLSKDIFVVGSSVGDVNESDVFLAKAGGAGIFVFEAGVPAGVAKLATNEGVKIYEFKIIYELLDELDRIIKGNEVEIASETEIITTFPFNGKLVAGCKVKKGTLTKTDSATLVRLGKEIGRIKILSMKKGKNDIEMAKQGEEFGLFFAPQLEFKAGDAIISHSNKN